MKDSLFLCIALALAGLRGIGQTSSVPARSRWDELTASDWPKALAASSEGQLETEHYIGQLVEALKAVKADTKTLELQKEYFDSVPLTP
jgi:hypothetical protein